MTLSSKKEAIRARLRMRLQRIQRAPEPRRKQWLAAASFVTMVLVVGLWVLYLNLVVPKPEWSVSEPAAAGPQLQKDGGDSLGKTLGRGFSAVGGEFTRTWEEAKEKTTEAFNSLKGTLEQKNQFTFEAPAPLAGGAPQSLELPPVPPALLPAAPEKTGSSTSQ